MKSQLHCSIYHFWHLHCIIPSSPWRQSDSWWVNWMCKYLHVLKCVQIIITRRRQKSSTVITKGKKKKKKKIANKFAHFIHRTQKKIETTQILRCCFPQFWFSCELSSLCYLIMCRNSFRLFRTHLLTHSLPNFPSGFPITRIFLIKKKWWHRHGHFLQLWTNLFRIVGVGWALPPDKIPVFFDNPDGLVQWWQVFWEYMAY